MTTKTAIARETEADVSGYLGALNTAVKEFSQIRQANQTTDAEIRRLRTSTRKKLGRIRENLDRVEAAR